MRYLDEGASLDLPRRRTGRIRAASRIAAPIPRADPDRRGACPLARELTGSGTTIAPPPPRRSARSPSGGRRPREGTDEECRFPPRDLPDRPTSRRRRGPGGEGRAEVVREGRRAPSGACHAGASAPRRASPARCRTRAPRPQPRRPRRHASRTCGPAEDEHDRPLGREPEGARPRPDRRPPSPPGSGGRRRGTVAVTPRDGEGEEDAARRRVPRRGSRARDARRPPGGRSESERFGDVDRPGRRSRPRPARRRVRRRVEDPSRRGMGGERGGERPGELDAGPPRRPRDVETGRACPAAGTSRSSPLRAANTLAPRRRSASATASAGRTCPAVPPAAIRARRSRRGGMADGDVKENPDGRRA